MRQKELWLEVTAKIINRLAENGSFMQIHKDLISHYKIYDKSSRDTLDEPEGVMKHERYSIYYRSYFINHSDETYRIRRPKEKGGGKEYVCVASTLKEAIDFCNSDADGEAKPEKSHYDLKNEKGQRCIIDENGNLINLDKGINETTGNPIIKPENRQQFNKGLFDDNEPF
jgi:hypothetical protein